MISFRINVVGAGHCTYSSSVRLSKQFLQMRTSNSKPSNGNVDRSGVHLSHSACPHFLQWCWVIVRKKMLEKMCWKNVRESVIHMYMYLTVHSRQCFFSKMYRDDSHKLDSIGHRSCKRILLHKFMCFHMHNIRL